MNTLNIESAYRYARFPRRIQALAVDVILLLSVFMFSASFAGTLQNPIAAQILILGTIVCVVLYDPVLVSQTGSTVGHRVLNLRVVSSRTGENPTFFVALLRVVLKGILGFVSFVFMAFTSRHQALHDLLAETTVEVRNPLTAPAYHFAAERVYDPGTHEHCSPFRRIAVAVGYSIVLLYVGTFFFEMVASDACVFDEVCTEGENMLLTVVGGVWLLGSIALFMLGWRGHLLGARSRAKEDLA